MPRVHFVKKARKDVPHSDIKAGESYYWWKFRYGGKQVSRTPPKQSQLTQSEFLGTIYGIDEQVQALTEDSEFETEIESIKDQLETLKSETEDKLSNMPDQLQEGDVGQMLQNRIDELDSMISEYDSLDLEVDEESIKEDVMGDAEKEEDETDEEFGERMTEAVDEAISERRSEVLQSIQDITYNGE